MTSMLKVSLELLPLIKANKLKSGKLKIMKAIKSTITSEKGLKSSRIRTLKRRIDNLNSVLSH